MENQKLPDVTKLTALKDKLASLLNDITAPVAVVPPPVETLVAETTEPRRPKTRDLAFEIKREEVRQAEEETGEAVERMFEAFDGLQDRANALRFQRTRTAIEEAELVALDKKIMGLADEFAQEIDLHTEWIGGHLDRADEYHVSCDFVDRGILREITLAEKEKNSTEWGEYKKLSPKEKDGGKFTKPPTVWTVRKDPREAKTAHYFVKNFVPKAEWPEGKNPWTEEKKRLLGAYAAHHQRMREEAQDRRVEREAVEAERRLEDEMFSRVTDPDVDQDLTLEGIADGGIGLARVALLAEHDWKSHPAAPPMTGTIYIRASGLVSEGIAGLAVVGATGGLRGYLSAKGVSFAQSFNFRVGRQFAGISDAETHEDRGFLRALFATMMGYKKSHLETPQSGFNTLGSALGGGGDTLAGGKASHHNGGGGKKKPAAWKEYGGGKQQGRRHGEGRPVRGGGNNWRQKYGA